MTGTCPRIEHHAGRDGHELKALEKIPSDLRVQHGRGVEASGRTIE
jgi:hypothetical protein